MKSRTAVDHELRIERVAGYLGQQLATPPSLRELADVAGISPFHFHRVYRALTGETPAATLRRLRLTRAAVMLRQTRQPVTRIAFDIGYESSQAFAKAFREATGSSASELRREPDRLDAVIRELSSPPQPPAGASLEVRLVSVDPFKVIASRLLGPHRGLFRAYGELLRWAERTGLSAGFRGIYGIPLDDPRAVPVDACRFDCCFDLGPEAEGEADYRETLLGGGLYAVARHVGPYEGLDGMYDALYGPWLSASGYGLPARPLYQHYLADPDTLPQEAWETDVYLPIEEVPDEADEP